MAFTNNPTEVFTHDPTQDLGHYVMPQLIQCWKTARAEHTYYYKEIAELKAKIRKADRVIGPAKKRDGQRATATKRLIRDRRLCHENVKPLETHLYMLKRQLYSYDTIFDSAIEPYARISSLSFTSAFYTKCPRELRDMVYFYLLDEPVPIEARNAWHMQLHYDALFSSKPTFLDSEFVHKEMLSEIMYTLEERLEMCSQIARVWKNLSVGNRHLT